MTVDTLTFRELLDSAVTFATDTHALRTVITDSLLDEDLVAGDGPASSVYNLAVVLWDSGSVAGVPGWEMLVVDISEPGHEAIMLLVERIDRENGYQRITSEVISAASLVSDESVLSLNMYDAEDHVRCVNAWVKIAELLVERANAILNEFRR